MISYELVYPQDLVHVQMQREEVVHVTWVHLFRLLLATSFKGWVLKPFVLKYLHTCHRSRSPSEATKSNWTIYCCTTCTIIGNWFWFYPEPDLIYNNGLNSHTCNVISYSGKLWYKTVYLLNVRSTVWLGLVLFRPISGAMHIGSGSVCSLTFSGMKTQR